MIRVCLYVFALFLIFLGSCELELAKQRENNFASPLSMAIIYYLLGGTGLVIGAFKLFYKMLF